VGIRWDDSIGAVKEFDRKYAEIVAGITRLSVPGGPRHKSIEQRRFMSKRWAKLIECLEMMQTEIDNLTEQVEQMQCEHECKVHEPRAVYTEGVHSMSFVYNEICNDCGKILRVGVAEEEYLKAKIAEAKQDAAEEISELEVALKKAREKKPVKKAKKQ
jgi:hypothetical protein